MFSWMGFVGVVRAEFLRARNFDYVRAARALGAKNSRIMFKHVLPNAMVATMTFMPFTLAGSVTILTSLDFLELDFHQVPLRWANFWPKGKQTSRRLGWD